MRAGAMPRCLVMPTLGDRGPRGSIGAFLERAGYVDSVEFYLAWLLFCAASAATREALAPANRTITLRYFASDVLTSCLGQDKVSALDRHRA